MKSPDIDSKQGAMRPRLWLGVAVALAAVVGMSGCAGISGGSDGNAHEPPPYQGTELDRPAPDFRLTDHRGGSIALSDFRGRIVALAFLDPNCADVCPLTALHFRQTYQALGEDASRVAFVAVNVNPGAASVADVAEASRRWGIADMPAWHFLTGSQEELSPVWQAYNVQASVPKHGKPGEVQHSPGVYLIDQEGRLQRYVSASFEGALPLGELLVRHIGPQLQK